MENASVPGRGGPFGVIGDVTDPGGGAKIVGVLCCGFVFGWNLMQLAPRSTGRAVGGTLAFYD